MKRTNISLFAACATVSVIAGAIIIENHSARPAAAPPTELDQRLAQLAPGAQLSPFTSVEFSGDTVKVTYAGADCELAMIDNVPVADLLDFCKGKYKDAWQKRLTEDLVVVLEDMGHEINPDHTVSLTLVDPKTGIKKDVPHALMTAENRRATHQMLSMK